VFHVVMPINRERCTECTAALEQRHLHCHEVVVQHLDGSFECAGGRCTVDVRVHRFVVRCAEVDCADRGFVPVELDLPLAA
jgi:hypothetical protein